MVHFVGAGPGAPDLITVRGADLLRKADCVIYAGSLVNPALLESTKPGCEIHNSAVMTLEQVIEVMQKADSEKKDVVRLHTGDASLFGAIREQMDELDRLGIAYDSTPGVSSFCGAAAALSAEYTLPGVSQSLIISRMAGRTPVPPGESLSSLAAPRRVDGAVSLLRPAARGAGRAAARRIIPRNARRDCIQGHLARRARDPLHRRNAGTARRGGRDPQNGAAADRAIPRSAL